MTAIDPALERYYEDVLDLFTHPGWKSLTEDLSKLRDECNKVTNCTNLDRSKGQVEMLDHFLGLPDLFNVAYTQMKAEAEVAEATGESIGGY